jgi:hypothetical protein
VLIVGPRRFGETADEKQKGFYIAFLWFLRTKVWIGLSLHGNLPRTTYDFMLCNYGRLSCLKLSGALHSA